MKENLYANIENQHRYYSHEIAQRAVNMFDKGYTLASITKRLTKSYRSITGLGSSEIGEIAGKAILDFVIKENRGDII